MATIALDATYSAEPQLTGIGVYSRHLIETLLTLETPHRFLICYRLSRLGRRRHFLQPGSIPQHRARFSVLIHHPHFARRLGAAQADRRARARSGRLPFRRRSDPGHTHKRMVHFLPSPASRVNGASPSSASRPPRLRRGTSATAPPTT